VAIALRLHTGDGYTQPQTCV